MDREGDNGRVNSSTNPLCIICGRTDWITLSELSLIIRSQFESTRILRCKHCGQGVLWPLPSRDEINEVYRSAEYVDSYDAAGESFAISGDRVTDQLASRFDIMETFLPKRGTVLDVGASRGYFLKEAKARGWSIAGIESGYDAVLFAKERFGIDVEHGSIESIDLGKQRFDCIHMSHVLEHLYDPVDSVKKLLASLRPGGLLIIEVPYEFGDLFDRLREFFLRRRRPPNTVPSTHLHFFTRDTLCKLLSDQGAEILRALTPRRNQSYESRLPLGTLVKSLVYDLEFRWNLGPLIEVYARKK